MAVISSDDRILAHGNPRELPFSAVSQVIAFYDDGSIRQGSGVVVGPDDVLTGGHVIYQPDIGQWATEVIVTPALDGMVKPYGVTAADFLTVSTEWGVRGLYAGDYGLIHLSMPIGFYTGWLEVIPTANPSEWLGHYLTSFGYPGDFGSNVMVRTDGTADWVECPILYFADDMDALPGQSGSPVLDENDRVVGIISHERLFPQGNAVVTFDLGDYQQIRSGIDQGDEYISPPVWDSGISYEKVIFLTGLYLALLSRYPDPDGLSYWIDRLQEGAKYEDVTAAFMVSEEYREVSKIPSAERGSDFVDACYRVILGREPDADGAAYWIDQLAEAGPTFAVTGFIMSSEYSKNIVWDSYIVFHTMVESFRLESYGTSWSEILIGTEGDDFMIAGGGYDEVRGGGGRDFIWGGPGNDVLEGGDGGDFLVWTIGDGRDLVLDFEPSLDVLVWLGEDEGVNRVLEADGVSFVGYDGSTIHLVGVEPNQSVNLVLM